MATADTIEEAFETGRPVRLHTHQGEVLVARVISCDADDLRFIVVRSSQPERYAVCDSTGSEMRIDEIDSATLLTEAQAERSGRRRTQA